MKKKHLCHITHEIILKNILSKTKILALTVFITKMGTITDSAHYMETAMVKKLTAVKSVLIYARNKVDVEAMNAAILI